MWSRRARVALRPECTRSADCEEGKQCLNGRCVASELLVCGADADCRTGEACERKAGRCVKLGAACTVEDVAEPCRDGVWTRAGEEPVRCVPRSAGRAEACNGVDDDCNGEIDEGIVPSPCEVQALGECRLGTRRCEGGEMACFPAAPTAEVCDGKDNDRDGSADEDGICPTISFIKQSVQCINCGGFGPITVVTTIGGNCTPGYRRTQCKVNQAKYADCSTQWKAATSTDCTCTVSSALRISSSSCEVEITQTRDPKL